MLNEYNGFDVRPHTSNADSPDFSYKLRRDLNGGASDSMDQRLQSPSSDDGSDLLSLQTSASSFYPWHQQTRYSQHPSRANNRDLYDFLLEAELDHYYALLTERLKIRTVHQIKYVEDSDLNDIGFSGPEKRRLRKFFERECPQTAIGKLRKRLAPRSSSIMRSASSSRIAASANLMDDSTSTIDASTNYDSLNRSRTLRSVDANVANSLISSTTPRKSSLTSRLTSTLRRRSRKPGGGDDMNDSCDYLPAPTTSVAFAFINRQQLEIGDRLLGQGRYGRVLEGIWRPSADQSVPVAVKIVQAQQLDDSRLASLHAVGIGCPDGLICLFGVCRSPTGDEALIVTELEPSRSLLDCLRCSRETVHIRFPVDKLHQFSIQIARGMSHLEHEGVVHGSLGARNVLVVSNDLVKISDFGLNQLLRSSLDDDESSSPIAPWLAPECLLQSSFSIAYSIASDMWAYGVTLWEAYSYGSTPWFELDNVQQLADTINPPQSGRLPQPEACPDAVYNAVLRAAWSHHPASRPSFSQLLDLLPPLGPERWVCCSAYDHNNSMMNGLLSDVVNGGHNDGGGGEGLNFIDRVDLNESVLVLGKCRAKEWKVVTQSGQVGLLPTHVLKKKDVGDVAVKSQRSWRLSLSRSSLATTVADTTNGNHGSTNHVNKAAPKLVGKPPLASTGTNRSSFALSGKQNKRLSVSPKTTTNNRPVIGCPLSVRHIGHVGPDGDSFGLSDSLGESASEVIANVVVPSTGNAANRNSSSGINPQPNYPFDQPPIFGGRSLIDEVFSSLNMDINLAAPFSTPSTKQPNPPPPTYKTMHSQSFDAINLPAVLKSPPVDLCPYYNGTSVSVSSGIPATQAANKSLSSPLDEPKESIKANGHTTVVQIRQNNQSSRRQIPQPQSRISLPINNNTSSQARRRPSSPSPPPPSMMSPEESSRYSGRNPIRRLISRRSSSMARPIKSKQSGSQIEISGPTLVSSPKLIDKSSEPVVSDMSQSTLATADHNPNNTQFPYKNDCEESIAVNGLYLPNPPLELAASQPNFISDLDIIRSNGMSESTMTTVESDAKAEATLAVESDHQNYSNSVLEDRRRARRESWSDAAIITSNPSNVVVDDARSYCAPKYPSLRRNGGVDQPASSLSSHNQYDRIGGGVAMVVPTTATLGRIPRHARRDLGTLVKPVLPSITSNHQLRSDSCRSATLQRRAGSNTSSSSEAGAVGLSRNDSLDSSLSPFRHDTAGTATVDRRRFNRPSNGNNVGVDLLTHSMYAPTMPTNNGSYSSFKLRDQREAPYRSGGVGYPINGGSNGRRDSTRASPSLLRSNLDDCCSRQSDHSTSSSSDHQSFSSTSNNRANNGVHPSDNITMPNAGSLWDMSAFDDFLADTATTTTSPDGGKLTLNQKISSRNFERNRQARNSSVKP